MSSPYIPQLLPPLIQYSADNNAQVRQASIYGVGVCAQYGGPLFAANLSSALSAIHTMVMAFFVCVCARHGLGPLPLCVRLALQLCPHVGY
jgi:hypothetical protein